MKGTKMTEQIKKTAGRKPRDLTNQIFGRLTAIEIVGKDKLGNAIWLCQCDCGNTKEVRVSSLTTGNTRSCGCLVRENNNLSYAQRDGTNVGTISRTESNKNSVTGVRGVCMFKGKYIAQISFQKKKRWLGTFETLEEAKEAREKAEKVFKDFLEEYNNDDSTTPVSD